MSKYLNEKVRSIPPSAIGKFLDIASSIEGVVSLSIGEPDFDTPWHIREEAIYALKKNKTHYAPSMGIESLREEIKNYLHRRFKLNYGIDEILVTVGASEAIDLIFRSIIDEGDEVIILEPCYVAYAPAITLAGGVIKTIPLVKENEYKLTKEALENAISDKTKAILLNFPSNPTGGVMMKEDYDAILPILKAHDIVIVSDEIYAELSYESPHYSLAYYQELADRFILVSGFSKAFAMTGWRIGYICASKELIKAFNDIHEYTIMSPASFAQYGAKEAMKNGDRDIEEMKLEFERRRNYVTGRLNQMGLRCDKPKGAFYVFPDISSTGLSSYDFAIKLIQEYKVATVPGDAFGESGVGHIRISYASDMEQLKFALDQIEKMLSDLKANN